MLKGIILRTIRVWVISAHQKHCSVGLESSLLFSQPAVLLQSATVSEKKKTHKKNHILSPARPLGQSWRRQVVCLRRRDVCCAATSVCVKAPAPSRGGREGNNWKNQQRSELYLHVLDRSHYSTRYAFWWETASNFLFPWKNEVQTYRFPLPPHFSPSSFKNSLFVGCPRFGWSSLGWELLLDISRCCFNKMLSCVQSHLRVVV